MSARHVGERPKPAATLLTVMGAINWDISIFEDRFAEPGEEVAVGAVEEFPGGKGANAAVAASRILGKGRVALLGGLGRDHIAELQLAELGREGVLTSGVLTYGDSSSGRAFIVIDHWGSKKIHTLFGANERVAPGDLNQKGPSEILARTRMLVVMDAPTQAGLAAAKTARANGATVIYSPCVRSREGTARLEGILARSDYLVLDRVELGNLVPGAEEGDALRSLVRTHPGLAVVETRGSEGCRVASAQEFASVPAVDLSTLGKRVVNSTGCGDAFLGAFSGLITTGLGFGESVYQANVAGALKSTRKETRGSPDSEELESAVRTLEGVRRKRSG